MKITMPITAAAAAVLATAGLVTLPTAAADTSLGQQGRLTNGDVVQAWTISDLRASTDSVPYQPKGTLWEATATDEAIQGSVIPVISNLNARSADGQSYRVLYQVATTQGVSPAALSQGEKTTGKIYFDVTGTAPNSVVYSDGDQDLLVWQPAAAPAPSTTGSSNASPHNAPAPATTSTPSTASPATATPSPAAAAPPAGSQGTPLPADQTAPATPAPSQGTPTPLSTDQKTSATPATASPATATPAPGSQGTPAPADQAVPARPASDGSTLRGPVQGPVAPAQGVAPALGNHGTPLQAGN